MEYRQCDVSELRNFVEARGLAKLPKCTSKKVLIQTLEDADDQMIFGHFMDLPPELRVSIYKLHVQSLEKPRLAAQPRIAQVSKTIRQETLPLFYRDMHMVVDLREFPVLSGKTTVPKVTLQPDRYRESLPSTALSNFDKINFRYAAQIGDPMTSAIWTIDLSAGASSGRMIRSTEKLLSNDEDLPEILVTSIERRVLGLVTELLTRPVEDRLHRYDFMAMRKVVEEAVQEYSSRSEG